VEYKPNAFKATLILPIQDNAGVPFPVGTWEWWRDKETQVLKGFTEIGVVKGFWRGQSERNKMISVVVKDENSLDELHQLLNEARAVFRQEAMYFDCHPVYFEEVR